MSKEVFDKNNSDLENNIKNIDHKFKVSKEKIVRMIKSNIIFETKHHTLSNLFRKILFEPQTVFSFVATAILIVAYISNTNEKEHLLVSLFTIVLLAIRTILVIYEENSIYKYYKQNIENYSCKLIKNQKIYYLDRSYLEINDILEFCKGDTVGADCIIISSKNLVVDVMELTQSSELVNRTNNDYLYAGEKIIYGIARAVVVGIGKNTKLAGISNKIEANNTYKSKIHSELITFVYGCLFLGLLLFVVVISAAVLYGTSPFKLILLGMTIVISLFPEGIPATISLLQHSAVLKLNEKKVFLRDMAVIEKFGLATIFISTKSTLVDSSTRIIESIYDGTYIIDIELAIEDGDYNSLESLKLIYRYVEILNEGLKNNMTPYKEGLFIMREILKNYFAGDGLPRGEIKFKDFGQVQELSYNDEDKKFLLIGELPKILKMCKFYIFNQMIVELDRGKKEKILEMTKVMNLEGYDVVGLACKHIDRNNSSNKAIYICSFFLSEIKEENLSILNNILHAGSIQFGLLTNTKAKGGLNICRSILGMPEVSVGIKDDLIKPTEKHKIVRMTKYESMNIESKKEVLSNQKFLIFNCSRHQKINVINDLKRANHMILFLGRNIDDLRVFGSADVSVTYDNSSQIVKEASSAIIKTNSTSDLIFAIEEGRLFFVNLTKAIKFVSMKVIPQLIPLLMYSLFSSPLALSPILSLVLNYFVVLLPVKTFAYEEPEYNLLEDYPILSENIRFTNEITVNMETYWIGWIFKFKQFLRRFYRIVTTDSAFPFNRIWADTIKSGIITGFACTFTFYCSLYRSGIFIKDMFFTSNTYFKLKSMNLTLRNGVSIDGRDQLDILYKAQSTFFMGLVICQLFNILICRRDKKYFTENFFSNFWMLFTTMLSLGVAIILVSVRAFTTFLLIGSVDILLLLIPTACGLILLLLDTIRKYKIKN